jgi:hypothetical protein
VRVIFILISITDKIIANHVGLDMVVVFVGIGMVIALFVKLTGHGQIGAVIAGVLHIIMDKIVILVIEAVRAALDRFVMPVKQLTP